MFRVALMIVGTMAPSVAGQMAQDKPKHVFTPHKQAVATVRMTPDGRVVVSQDSTGNVRASDLSGRKLFLPGGVVRPTHIRVGLIGDSSVAVLLGRDGVLRAWSPLGGVLHHETRVASPALAAEWVLEADVFRVSNPPTQLNGLPAFGAGNRLMAAMGSDYQVHVWDTATGKLLGTLEGKHSQQFVMLTEAFEVNGQVRIRTIRKRLTSTITAAFSPDGKTMAVQVTDPTTGTVMLRIHALPTGKVVKEWDASQAGITIAAFSPDSRWFAWSGGQEIQLWDLAKQKEGHKIGREQGDIAAGLVFDGDSGALIAVGLDVQHWDPATGGRLRRIDFPVGNKTLMSMPGHRWIVRGSRAEDGALRLMEAATGRMMEPDPSELAGFPLHVFSPDGRTGFALGNPGLVREMLTGTTLLQLPPPHGNGVNSATFGANGSLLVTGGSNGSVAVWDWRRLGSGTGGKEPGPLWDDLGSKDGAVAHKAMAAMLGDPKKAVALLGEKSKPVSKDEWQKLEKLVAQLDSRKFAEREEARKLLAERGSEISFMLQRVLSERPSLEMRRRIEELVDDLKTNVGEGDYLRRLRTVQALEWLGTAEAKKVLESLASGHPDARLTREAKAALGRMK